MKYLKNIFRKTAYIISFFSCLFVLLAFTEIPYQAYHNLASIDELVDEKPKTIVLMGGEGMPSPSGLMRTYYTAKNAEQFASAKIIIALPSDAKDSSKQLKMMAQELVLRGIDTNRIVFASKGFNTRSQALEVAELIPDKSSVIMLVSSPEHMFRCIKSFKKVGFKKISGNPAFEVPNSEAQLKGKLSSKDEVKNLSLRYNLWSYMQYEIIVMREYVAIAYYWFMGWI